jgi:hypothetical protein
MDRIPIYHTGNSNDTACAIARYPPGQRPGGDLVAIWQRAGADRTATPERQNERFPSRLAAMGGAPDHDDATGRPADEADPALEPDLGDLELDADLDLDELDELDLDPDDLEVTDDRGPEPFDAGGDMSTRIAHAKRRHGTAGAALAAGMLGVDQIVSGRKPREEAPIVIASNSDPLDIDTDGISLSLADADVAVPPLPRTEPKTAPTSGKRRRWR